MVDLKDRTVEELRKIASKKKIEGRSKMNKAELVRALKKKTSSKKMKGGMNKLPNNVQSHIKSFTSCKDIIKYFSSLNKSKLQNFNWDNLPEIPFDISPEVNLNIDCVICNLITNEENKQKCKIYYNKCRILDLFKKYDAEQYIGPLVNIGGLTNLLKNTIMNTGNMNSVRNDQEYLQRIGIVYNEINKRTFINKSLTSVTIPNFVTRIGARAFDDNILTSVTIPDSVIEIGKGAFIGNQLVSIRIPDSVIEIGDWAFNSNRLESVVIPNSVMVIGDWAFDENPQLATVTIPRRFEPELIRIFGEQARTIQFTFTDP